MCTFTLHLHIAHCTLQTRSIISSRNSMPSLHSPNHFCKIKCKHKKKKLKTLQMHPFAQNVWKNRKRKERNARITQQRNDDNNNEWKKKTKAKTHENFIRYLSKCKCLMFIAFNMLNGFDGKHETALLPHRIAAIYICWNVSFVYTLQKAPMSTTNILYSISHTELFKFFFFSFVLFCFFFFHHICWKDFVRGCCFHFYYFAPICMHQCRLHFIHSRACGRGAWLYIGTWLCMWWWWLYFILLFKVHPKW